MAVSGGLGRGRVICMYSAAVKYITGHRSAVKGVGLPELS